MPPTSNAPLQIKELLAQDTLPGCLLITGPDEVRRERLIEALLRKFSPHSSEPNFVDSVKNINAANLNRDALVALSDDTTTLSLFSKKRIFVVKNIPALQSSLRDQLISIIKSLNSDNSFLISSEPLAASDSLLKFLNKEKKVVVLPELKGHELKRWVTKEFQINEITQVSEEVIDAVINAGESQPDKIYKIIEHFALFLDGARPSIESLALICDSVSDTNEFAVIDLLTSSNPWKARILIQNILKSGKSPFALLGLLARNYSQYLKIAYLKSQNLNMAQIRHNLEISPWLFNKQCKAVESYSLKRLLNCQNAILIADLKLKNRSLGHEAIFDELCSRFASNS